MADIPTILIVDDEAKNLHALEHMLERPDRMIIKAMKRFDTCYCTMWR